MLLARSSKCVKHASNFPERAPRELNARAIRSPPFKRLCRMHTHVTIYNLCFIIIMYTSEDISYL